MAETEQVNVRIPSAARTVLTRIGARLRERPEFAAELERYLDSLDDPTVTPNLAERVARLEAWRESIEGGKTLVDNETSISTPTDTPQGTPALTTGEGRGRRLTTAGELEVERRIEAGETDATIAAALQVSTNTVRARRQKIDERLL